MIGLRRSGLLAQKSQLDRLAEVASPDDAITMGSLMVRQQLVSSELSSLGAGPRKEPPTVLTFSGAPVEGTRGIFADFAAEATGLFATLVATIASAQIRPLPTAGRLPGANDYRLMITGIARGSFGFVLEEPGDPAEDSLVSQAVTKAQKIVDALAEHEDEEVAELASVDPRVLSATRKFVGKLANAGAICTIAHGEKRSGFRTVGEVERSVATISEENVKPTTYRLEGFLDGVLPHSRRFEFTTTEGERISGKLGDDIGDVDVIKELSAKSQSVTAMIDEIKIGTARPRYVLTELIPD